MTGLLKDKLAIITGGGRGIGRAIAERFAKEECNLVLVSRTYSELEETANSIKNKFPVAVDIFEADISKESEILAVVHNAHKEFGEISILINNAGIIGPIGEVSDIDGKEFMNTLNVNVGGTFLFTKAVVPYMKEQKKGCIINLSGGGALKEFPYYDAYSASKSAIVRLTENFALELEKFNINVSAISPGPINTKMFYDQLEINKDSLGEVNWKTLLDQEASGGRSPDNACELALFLVSQEGKLFNGRVISAIWDNWEEISNSKRIKHDDFKMRRIVPKASDLDN